MSPIPQKNVPILGLCTTFFIMYIEQWVIWGTLYFVYVMAPCSSNTTSVFVLPYYVEYVILSPVYEPILGWVALLGRGPAPTDQKSILGKTMDIVSNCSRILADDACY